MKVALTILVGAAIAFVILKLLGGVLQRSLTYYPYREPVEVLRSTAAASGFEPWNDPARQQIGWQSVAGNPEHPVLILHGNSGYALHRTWLAEMVRAADPLRDPKIFILEYPGYGFRAGGPSEAALLESARTALHSLSTTARTVVLGESLGAGVACLLAAAEPEHVAGLVLLTPFDSLVSAAKHHYGWLPVDLLTADRFDSVKSLQSFNGPVTFLIGGADEITPPQGGQRLYDSYRGPKQIFVAEGAGHNEAAMAFPQPVWQKALRFAAGL